MDTETKIAVFGVGMCFVTVFVALAAWITHIVVCIKTASFLLLLAGAIVAPVGIIHGVGIWFGYW